MIQDPIFQAYSMFVYIDKHSLMMMDTGTQGADMRDGDIPRREDEEEQTI